MAGHARYTALLDACVLYPVALSDALMSLAVTGLFAAKCDLPPPAIPISWREAQGFAG